MGQRGKGRQAKGQRVDAYESIFTALAHPVRRRILHTLYFAGDSMTAGEIAALFAQAWPTTTRHLGVLVDAGLLQREAHGRERVYCIDRARLKLAGDWIGIFFKDNR